MLGSFAQFERELIGERTRLGLRKLAKVDLADTRVHQVSDYLGKFIGSYEKLSNGQRRLLMQALVKEVVVFNRHECKAHFNIPLASGLQPTERDDAFETAESIRLFSKKGQPEPDYNQVSVPLLVQSGSHLETRIDINRIGYLAF